MGAVLGQAPTEDDFDGRASLPFLLDMGFASIVGESPAVAL